MNRFGEALRRFRNASNDPERDNRRLTQERLGGLIGVELGDLGVSGAAVSEWELGKSKPSAEDRKVLIALISVLYKCGGLKTLDDAQQFLKWGNYRALESDEVRTTFPDGFNEIQAEQAASREKSFGGLAWLAEMFSITQGDIQQMIDKAREGPEPSWPRVLAALMRMASDRFSPSMITILWVSTWTVALWVMSPSLRFPFSDYDTAYIAFCMYSGGSMAIPLLIGALVNTKDSAYWKEQNGVGRTMLRLYTYQGAGVGFNVGYFLALPLSLVRHYMGFGPAIWVELLAATVSVILGNMGARVVPHNLWLAYGQLRLRDGWIFFAVAFVGPLWAFFFLQFYSTLLHPVFGIVVILLALSGVVLIARKSSQKQTA